MANVAPASPATFGQSLRRHRQAAGLSQEALAERAGLSVRGLSDLERGARLVPRAETIRMLADALELSASDMAALAAAARPGQARPTPTTTAPPTPPHGAGDLPAPPTPLIGRERDVERLVASLRDGERRLLTLTGPGGVGKTRLALAAADEARDAFPDGVVFVDLASLGDPALIASAIAQTLGLHESGGRPLLDVLVADLRDRHGLLVLDNLEHLLPGVTLVSDLLARCVRLTALATSRVRLHLRGEREWRVRPLALPEAPPGASAAALEHVGEAAAVRLFVARAADITPGFALTQANAADVVAICRRLDGLPLALELAAAWSKMFPPHALRPRLEARSLALTRGARDLPARQQTLRATLTWSHDLLEPAERTLLRRLAVFAGGCTIAAAEAVTDHAGDLGLDPLDGLARLVDKSLAIEEAGDDAFPRFGMYETVREFALEQLEASGEGAALRSAHAHCFLALAEAAEPELEGSEQGVWLDRLETDHPNLRAALRWSFDSGDHETALRIGAALSRFWWLRGHLSEGRAWLERALASAAGAPPSTIAKATIEAGYHAYFAGDHEQAKRRYGETLTLSQAIDDPTTAVRALNGLGNLARQRGHLDEAAACYGNALALARPLDDQRIVARVLGNLGFLVARRGALGESQALLEENLDLARRLGDRAHECATLSALGDVALAAGDPASAAARYRAGFALSREIGDMFIIAECLAGLASVAFRSGQAELAARLLGAASALSDTLGAPRDHTLPDLHQANEDELRRVLGDAAFSAAFEAGRARPLAEAEADLVRVRP